MGTGATIAGIGIALIAVGGLAYVAIKGIPSLIPNLFGGRTPTEYKTPAGYNLPSDYEQSFLDYLQGFPSIEDVPFIEGASQIPKERVNLLEDIKQAFKVGYTSGTISRSYRPSGPLGSGPIAGIRGKPLAQQAISRTTPTYIGSITTKTGGTRLIAGSNALFNRLQQNLYKSSLKPTVDNRELVAKVSIGSRTGGQINKKISSITGGSSAYQVEYGDPVKIYRGRSTQNSRYL